MTYKKILNEFEPFIKRTQCTAERLSLIRAKFDESNTFFSPKRATVFCAGSIARQDSGKKSDLDLFIIADEETKLLDTYHYFSKLININQELNYPTFSNDGEFLKVYQLKELIALTGSRVEDSQNVFTARMLLLLESKPVCNDTLYEDFLSQVIKHYCRDANGHMSPFKPLFLLNDLLRYWRTLCLNYETIRHDPKKPWRKKNINLKFSRMLTVFGTVLPLITESKHSYQGIIDLCKLSPLERLAKGLDALGNPEWESEFLNFLENYEYFLSLKETENIQDNITKDEMANLDTRADEFSSFLYSALTHHNVPLEYRRYLVV